MVTNYHQLKGLEFDHVVIFGLDDQPGSGAGKSGVINQPGGDLDTLRLNLRIAPIAWYDDHGRDIPQLCGEAFLQLWSPGGFSLCSLLSRTKNDGFECVV